jgi:hypothetical protein
MRPLPRCHNASRCYQWPDEHLDREVAHRLQAMLLNGKTMAIFSPPICVVVKLRGAPTSLWRSCRRPRRRGYLQTSLSALLPTWKELAMNVVIAICIGKSSESRNNNEPRNNETVKVLHNGAYRNFTGVQYSVLESGALSLQSTLSTEGIASLLEMDTKYADLRRYWCWC